MGSSSKKHKEGKRKRHHSRSDSNERESPKEKKHRHRKHHKERKREKVHKHDYDTDGNKQTYDPNFFFTDFFLDSDVIEVSSSREVTPPPPQISKSGSPDASGQSSESLSIEETNRLRAKLGLKPLDVRADSNKDSKKKDDYGEFYHKPAGNIGDKHRQEKLKAKLSDHREKRGIESKLLKTKTLGESDSDDDVHSWIHKTRKLDEQKKDAAKRARMLEELDAQFGVGDIVEEEVRHRKPKYTERHLKGLQVNHNVEKFQEGKTVVLTLQDSEILSEKDDVLVNVNMIDDEKYKKVS